ncbi:MAG: T9SS type A sorting domain-containing protein [Bacteroidota bacterium]
MKITNLLLLFVLIIGLQVTATAQCTPDPSVSTSPGIYPDTLIDGEVGSPYNQVINLVFPQDTMVDLGLAMINADFCSFTLDSIPNLPDGMTFECDVPNCVWEIDHTPGVINRGCVTLSGTPLGSIPDDTLTVIVSIDPGTFNPMTMTCDSLQGVPPAFLPLIEPFLTQNYRTGFRIIDGAMSIENELSASRLGLELFPNPAEQNTFLQFDLPRTISAEIRLVDQMGKEVACIYEGQLLQGNHAFEVNTQDLSSGLYMVLISFEKGSHQLSQKLMVQ